MHSPGPWTLSGDIVVGAPEPRPNIQVEPYGHVICKLAWSDRKQGYVGHGDLPWQQALENANLILAAPEMLAVLKDWLSSPGEGRHFAAARAVVAKAEGKPA